MAVKQEDVHDDMKGTMIVNPSLCSTTGNEFFCLMGLASF